MRIKLCMANNLPCERIEVDEIWGFIGAKAKTVKEKKLSPEMGDIWTRIALDSDTKLIPRFHLGNRRKYEAITFMDDLTSRMRNRIQISSDSLSSYVDAVERAFGGDVDYGSLVKTFTATSLEETRRYSPPEVLKVKKG
jgi:hypothetical protein